MNILHIVGKDLIEGNGITSAVPPLIREQNKIEGVNSKLLVISENQIDYKEKFLIDYYICKDTNKIENHIKNEYKVDLVVFHEVYYMSFIKIYKVLKKLDIPYIVKPHCSLTKVAQAKNKFKKIVANKLIFEKFILKSNAVSFLNQDEKNKSILNYHKSIIENNGIDIDENRSEIKCVNNEVNLIYLSRIDLYHKGLDVLIEAICDIKDQEISNKKFNIKIYGNGKEEDVKFVKNKLNDLNKSFVEFKGPIYGLQKEKLMKDSDIFILTSRLEGMPMTILEAWANGMPCIITPGTNMCTDIYSNEKLGWISEFDKDCIKDCILKAVDSYREKKNEYNEECIGWVKNKYQWDKIAKDSIDKYNKII